MTAGSISAPLIVPLRIPVGAKRHDSKHTITEGTPIAITSDTNDTTLYYTINGMKPDPFQRSGHQCTYLYQSPFTLPASEKAVTVRAIAISSDGHKQSSVVTKTYFVKTSLEPAQTMSSINKPTSFSTATSTVFPASSSFTGPQYLLNRFASKARPDAATMPTGVTHASHAKESSLTVHAPSDYKMCVYCNAKRPEDLHAKFCPKCGRLLPFLPVSKPEVQPTIGLSVCGSCRTMVPVGSVACIVCEAPIDPPPRLPIINAQLDNVDDIKGKPVCLACGTVNATGMRICVTCEKPLEFAESYPQRGEQNGSATKGNNTLLKTTANSGVYLLCSDCGRINASDARFCDWCGKKPSGPQQPVICANCSATNSWESRHCVSCSAQLRPPTRHGMQLTSSMKIPMTDVVDANGWVPLLDTTEEGPVTCNVSTQTEGLFYPSSRTISKSMTAEAVLTSWTIKKHQIGAYSPGRGFWRQQINHICSHLKAYTQSCPDFQEAIGKPQMGKLVSATLLNEDTELKMHLTYSLKSKEAHKLDWTAVATDPELLSSMLANSTGSVISEESTVVDTPDTTITSQRGRRSRRKKRKKPLKDSTAKVMEELSTRGNVEEVERLLKDEGANPNATTASGLYLLSLAATNGHCHCLRTLVKHKADLNGQSEKTGNTALHEAIFGGPGNLDCVKVLLELGANTDLKNKAGQTACELAAKKKYEKIVTCIASHKGASQLRKLCKPPSKHDIAV